MIDDKLESMILLLCALPAGVEETPVGLLVIDDLIAPGSRQVKFYSHELDLAVTAVLDCESHELFELSSLSESFWDPDSPERERVLNEFAEAIRACIGSLSPRDRARLLANCLKMGGRSDGA